MLESIKPYSIRFQFVCHGPDGREKWREDIDNLVTTVGKTFAIDTLLKGSAYTAAWYLMLMGAGTKDVGDTMASHAGWSELTPYSGNRPAITWGTTISGSNTSSGVVISITGTASVAGAGITTVNTGTSGTLYNAADFSSVKNVVSGDTLTVTLTMAGA